MNRTVVVADQLGIRRACEVWNVGGREHAVFVNRESDWPSSDVFEQGASGLLDGGTAAAGLRTTSKGSSRGAGPQKKQGRVRRGGGQAERLHLCPHGQRAVQCTSCPAWHCACPGSLAHVCSEAA